MLHTSRITFTEKKKREETDSYTINKPKLDNQYLKEIKQLTSNTLEVNKCLWFSFKEQQKRNT